MKSDGFSFVSLSHYVALLLITLKSSGFEVGNCRHLGHKSKQQTLKDTGLNML